MISVSDLLNSSGAFIVVITGLLAAIGGLYKGVLSARARQTANFQELYDVQKRNLDDAFEQIKQIRSEWSADRQQWANERKEMQHKIDDLDKLNGEKDVRIAELQGEINGLKASLVPTSVV